MKEDVCEWTNGFSRKGKLLCTNKRDFEFQIIDRLEMAKTFIRGNKNETE